MTIREALAEGVKGAEKIEIEDAEILLAEATEKPKEFLFSHPEKKLTTAQVKKYLDFVHRRAKSEPVAYIIGKKEFYGLEFLVSPDVLIPRPETELLIDIAKNVANPITNPQTIIDIGTGSGTIAITLKKNFPQARIFAFDASESALKIARKNARKLKAKIIFKKSDLLKNLPSSVLRELSRGNLLIVANLPYISEQEWLALPAGIKKYEPKSALIGGKNGWELYEKLFQQLNKLQIKNTTLIIEISYNQKTQIIHLIKKYFSPKKIEAHRDLSKNWRVILAK